MEQKKKDLPLSVVATDQQQPKRKRGRPAKQKQQQDKPDNRPEGIQATQQAGTMAGSAPTVSPGQRKRGRPSKNNGRISATNDNAPVASAETDKGSLPAKKRGRPAGRKNNKPRPDRQVAFTESGDNRRMINYTLALSRLPIIDYNNPAQMKQRIMQFFDISAEFDFKPAVATLALALGIDRMTLFNWLTGKSKRINNPECLYTLKTAYTLINSQYEIMMNTGKINPVAGIFLMKNNLGYQDTTQHIVTTGNDHEQSITDITSKAGLLTDV